MRSPAWICATFVALVCVPSTASAYEDQATLALAVGWAGIPGSSTLPRNGVDVGLSAGFGITDAWGIQGVLSYNVFPDERRLQMGVAGLEAIYLLDIVRFVPIFGFGIDGLVSGRADSTRGDFALHALVGFDYLISDRWSVGADARGYWVATNANSFLDPFFVTVAARVGVRFDTH
ncbi:MAG: porin family protein [Myxococcales bacterium]|nr:porin family protein [Myxococcales bacterium]MDH3486083.1 porin family protein [Myxococcales bacterium]